MLRRGLASIVSGAALFTCASMASAITIWAPDNLGTTNVGSVGDRVIRFDSANPNGTVVTVGSTGVANVGMAGMDFAANGNLYAASGFGSGFAGTRLYSVSTANGAATVIGTGAGILAGDAATDLSWNPVLGQMQMITYNGTVNNLYTLNLTTGAGTLIGTITGAAGGLDIGLATSSAGVNYLHDIVTDRMYTLAGLVATPMASTLGFDTNFSQGMTINWSGANEWFLGAFNNTTFQSQVYTVNIATGAPTLVSTWPVHAANGLPEYETGDLAIAPTGGITPEPASLGLLGLGLGAMVTRRRRTA